MRIGIDVSQLAYGNTGVANYLSSLVSEIVKNEEHEYVLFFSSLRRSMKYEVGSMKYKNVKVKKFKFPLALLDLLWNRLHILPIELFIGKVDWFITSDWTEPPSKAKKATIIYDLIVFKQPEETDRKIVEVQKRKLAWVKKESDIVLTISESSMKDAADILGLDPNKVKVIYPGKSYEV